MATGIDCVIVDDGSSAESLAQIKAFIADKSGIHFFEHKQNRGKGAAVKTGLMMARQLGFTHALQIDADGQHSTDKIPEFIEESKKAPATIICGKPVYEDSAPKARVYGRKVTDFWMILETLSYKIKDGLCGFRVYPLAEMEQLLDKHFIGPRMDFDTEILVKSVWMGFELKFINIKVIYPEGAVSHFHYLRDNLVLIRLHTRLMFGMGLRLPMLVWQRIQGR